MLEPNWTQPRPGQADIELVWRELNTISLSVDDSAITELLSEFRKIGKAEFATFKLSEHPVLHWFGSRHRLHEIEFIPTFLCTAPVSTALAALNITNPISTDLELIGGSAFTFDGELAQTLCLGGAEQKFFQWH